MKFLAFGLWSTATLGLWGQRALDPWLDGLHPLPAVAWVEHSGPSPGWTGAHLWLRRGNLSGGVAATPIGLQAWAMSDLAWRGGQAGMGLGWDGRQPQILARGQQGPWTAQCVPLRGTWAVSWRQRQTSGWNLVAHVHQDLRARQTEWVIGLEKPALGLYATSLGRWRVVYRRGALRLALGGGQTPWSSVGFQTGSAP